MSTALMTHANVALLLVMLGLALLAAEAFVPAYGVLGLSGAITVSLGAAMLAGDLLPGATHTLVVGVGLLTLAGGLLVWWLAVRIRRLRSPSGAEALVGASATVLDWSATASTGHVMLAGERWQASGEAALRPGQRVRVRAVQGLRVQVTVEAPSTQAVPRPPSATP